MLNNIRNNIINRYFAGIIVLSIILASGFNIALNTLNYKTTTNNEQNNTATVTKKRETDSSNHTKDQIIIVTDTSNQTQTTNIANTQNNVINTNDSSNLNSTINTNNSNNIINNGTQPNHRPTTNTTNYSNPNLNRYLLARIIYAEARGETLEGQVAVGAVLLNRLKDSRFPNTLEQIIFKKGEFCTVRDGQIWKTPNQQALRAAELAISGWDPTNGALYFYNPAKTTSRWIWSRPIVNKIGNHTFAI